MRKTETYETEKHLSNVSSVIENLNRCQRRYELSHQHLVADINTKILKAINDPNQLPGAARRND